MFLKRIIKNYLQKRYIRKKNYKKIDFHFHSHCFYFHTRVKIHNTLRHLLSKSMYRDTNYLQKKFLGFKRLDMIYIAESIFTHEGEEDTDMFLRAIENLKYFPFDRYFDGKLN